MLIWIHTNASLRSLTRFQNNGKREIHHATIMTRWLWKSVLNFCTHCWNEFKLSETDYMIISPVGDYYNMWTEAILFIYVHCLLFRTFSLQNPKDSHCILCQRYTTILFKLFSASISIRNFHSCSLERERERVKRCGRAKIQLPTTWTWNNQILIVLSKVKKLMDSFSLTRSCSPALSLPLSSNFTLDRLLEYLISIVFDVFSVLLLLHKTSCHSMQTHSQS